ncbi:MAG: cytochrome c oxidase subunit I, partial [Acidimicrobiales bacterium]
MTTTVERPELIGPEQPPGSDGHRPDPHGAAEGHAHHEGPTGILNWLTSTDHKVIGKSYMITSLVIFFIAGIMALIMRTQLADPTSSLVSFQTYNELFTMHGSLMMYLFAGPFAFGGLANYILPLQIGAPDMAFPRLNALSYWLYLGGSITMLSGFLVAGGAASYGWVAYAPLSNAINSPGAGADLWLMALALTGFSAIFTGVNLCATTFYLRAPGMTMFRIPIFSWNMLVTAILILIAFPVLFGAVVMLFCDRHFGTHIFSVQGGGVPVLWQHLFWFFGHPEVYILALPGFGVISEIISVFCRKPLFGYKISIAGMVGVGLASFLVWQHHLFDSGINPDMRPLFMLTTEIISIPTGFIFLVAMGTFWKAK